MNRSYLIAGLVAIGTVIWIATGDIVGAGSQAPEQTPTQATAASEKPKAEAGPTAVRVAVSKAEPRRRDIVVRGRTAVEKKVDIKAEVQARVIEVVQKGTRVRKGQTIARLALDDRMERLKESKAMMRLREVELNAARELHAKGFKPQNKLMENEAQYDAAKAMVARMEMEMAKTAIVAPFDGVVEDVAAEVGAFLKVGDPVAALVSSDPMLVIGQVSERDIGQVRLGQAGVGALATGETLEGKIRFIATTAEPQTRTFRVELEVPNPNGLIRDGITTEMRLPVQSVPAHRLSPQALTLNDAGIVGLRLVDETGRVQFKPAEILSESLDGVWIGGLPETITVIVVGQEFVREGQLVKPVPASERSGS